MVKISQGIKASLFSAGMVGLVFFTSLPVGITLTLKASDEITETTDVAETDGSTEKSEVSLSIKTKSKTFKYAKLQEAKKTFRLKVKASFTDSDSDDELPTLSYEKLSGDKCLKLSKAGVIKVKKGTAAGKYSITVKVSSSETDTYSAASVTKKITVTVKETADDKAKAAYDEKVVSFLKDKRFKNGASYGVRSPKLSSYSCVGCCAYAADFVKYVFDKDSPRAGSAFKKISSIKAGDVLRFINGQHWVVVLYRDGDQLITAEGNWGSKVVVSDSAYTITNGTLYRSGSRFRTFDIAYHYL